MDIARHSPFEDTMLPPTSAALLDSQVGFHIEGRGHPVVLLHSSMGSKGQWRALVERMRRSHRLIAIDLHGYGTSPMPPVGVPFTLQHEVGLIDTVLAVALLPGESFHLVGHSYGAAVALQLARSRPHRLRSLALYEPVAIHLLPPGHRGRLELEAVRDELQRCADDGDALAGARGFIDYWSGAGAFAQLPRHVQNNLAQLVRKTLLDFEAIARERSTLDGHRHIDVPVCLFAGASGPRPPRDVLDALADALPQARRHRIDAGHMAPVTHSWLVNPVLETFIRGIDGDDALQPVRALRA
ncbi:MAG TPA: alpha/beta hydrolase [Burkholderiaceae bacterium]|nr:alpha/beta hydrolase [Burkholderiaceae bacterium]